MFNLGDDSELDRFSREAAGRYSPPGEPNWEKLSIELDKVLPVEEKKRRFVFFWWLLPVLLIGGAVTYWLSSKNETKLSVAIITGTKKQSSNTSTSIAPEVVEKNENSATAGNKPISKEIKTSDKSSGQQSAVNPPVSKPADQTEKTLAKTSITKNRNIALPDLSKDLSAKKTKMVSSQKSVLPGVINVSNTTVNNTESNTSKQTVTVQQETKIETKGIQESMISEKNAETIIAQKEETINTQIKKDSALPTSTANSNNTDHKPTSVIKGRGFSYSFLAGVDKSTVKYRYGFDPGYNFGVMGGYHFNSKWSVHTGVIYTKKNYKLDGADFTAPKGTPASYYKLDLVDGYCKMWEVPLLIRYTIPKARGNSLFLSAGLTSYFMTNEDYNYYYKYLGMPVVKNTSYNSTDTHILSIIHLSAGFSKAISKTWDMQMEPYAKIPLGGVGYGSIELSSFGINFSLQHRQPLKK